MNKPTCTRCDGKGWYMYDHNHAQPCPDCCDHTAGWWELTEHHQGYIRGADNGCCRKGCGTMRRDLPQTKPTP